MLAPFPWQNEIWQQLIACAQASRLPHALLLTGAPGLGKQVFAEAFASVLLCTAPHNKNNRCGACRSCQLLDAQTHPDLIVIQPEENSSTIKIDQIRELTDQLNQTAQQGGYKVVIINPADALNTAAANALLKTLEEPSPKTLILLITATPSTLSATIRSRCQKILFKAPQLMHAKSWLRTQLDNQIDNESLLAIADGAPLLAVELAKNNVLQQHEQLLKDLLVLTEAKICPLKLAATWQNVELDQLLKWLSSWVMDVIRLSYQLMPQKIIHQEMLQQASMLSQRIALSNLFNYFDSVNNYNLQLRRKINLNQQLVVENLFCQWKEIACVPCN